MFVKPRVLSSDKGIDQFLRNFIERFDNPPLIKKLGNFAVIIGIDSGDDGRVIFS